MQVVQHIELDTCNSGLAYSPGDLLATLPEAPQSAGEELLQHMGVASGVWMRTYAVAHRAVLCSPAGMHASCAAFRLPLPARRQHMYTLHSLMRHPGGKPFSTEKEGKGANPRKQHCTAAL